jgi:biotin carboxyl carrier protein
MSLIAEVVGVGSHEFELVRDASVARIQIDGVPYRVASSRQADGSHEVLLDGRKYTTWVVQRGDKALVHAFGRAWTVVLHDPVRDASAAADASDACIAPMPGTVVELRVAVGDAVAAGQVLMVIESMKMQMNLEAARDGVVAEINCARGEVFDRDAVLIRLAPKED